MKLSFTTFLLVFVFVNSASSIPVKKNSQTQYDEVMSHLCDYVHQYFKKTREIKIFKEPYLPKRSCRKSGVRIKYVNLDEIKEQKLEGAYVLKILEVRLDNNLHRIGVVCYKVGLAQDKVELANTSSITYWFEQSNGKMVFLKSNGGLPADFK